MEEAQAHARALRGAIVSELVAGLAHDLDELAAGGTDRASPTEVEAVLSRARDAWSWAGREVEIAVLVARELPRFAWDVYRERRWDDLRTLLSPIEAMSDDLATHVERDPAMLAYAAQSAQLLVFRAELGPTLDRQLVLAERAFALCPSLRNARLVLGDLLCARAERRLDAPVLLRPPDAVLEARRDVERAASIFPDLRRLPALRARLARGGPP
jgi:hypothetical protein